MTGEGSLQILEVEEGCTAQREQHMQRLRGRLPEHRGIRRLGSLQGQVASASVRILAFTLSGMRSHGEF